MAYEPPVLSEFIAAGDEINLALLQIDSKEFSTDGDRKTARRAVLATQWRSTICRAFTKPC